MADDRRSNRDGRGPRVAVIGSGQIGRWHAQELTRAGGRVVAVVDTDVQRAERLARRFRCRCYADVEVALNSETVDVVHVCTPPEDHVTVVSSALRVGVHVLVEKPLAPDASTTTRLLEEAARRGLLVSPVHQMCFQRGFARLATDIGRLGTLHHIGYTLCSGGAARQDRNAQEHFVGHVLSHPLSLFDQLLPGALPEARWQVHSVRAGELQLVGRLRSVCLSVLVSVRARPTRNELRVLGDRATGRVDLYHGFCTHETGKLSRANKILLPFQSSIRTLAAASTNLLLRSVRGQPAYPGLRELMVRFYAAISGAAPAPFTPESIHGVALARDNILQLIQEARPGRQP